MSFFARRVTVSQARAIYEIRKTCFNARIPSTRGTLRGRHDSSVRDAMDASGRKTCGTARTVKSCGRGPPTLESGFVRDDRQGDGG